MTALPHGLAEPLHIEEPFPVGRLLLGLLLLWLLYKLARWLLPRLAAVEGAAPPPTLTPVRALPAGGIVGIIGEIKRRYRGDYRRGCHELAAALKRHFGERRPGAALRHPFPKLTTGEIRARLGDTAVSRLFQLLADLQFQRREPTRSDFEGACDLAAEVARQGR